MRPIPEAADAAPISEHGKTKSMANPEPPDASLERAREKTNESLKSERERADEALTLNVLVSASQEDEILESKREQIDKTQEEKRATHDVVREELREVEEGPEAIKRAEALIERERALADKAIAEERQAADLARQRERRRLRLTAEALLVTERSTTDKDLSTERSRVDQELDRAAGTHSETRDALDTQSETMAIVSHDLRNPLMAITMSSEALLARLRAPQFDRDAALRSVAVIQRNSALMDRLIRDLLDAERIEAGKIAVRPTRQSVQALLGDCEELFGALARSGALTLHVAPSSETLFAEIEHDRILQVLSNLIGNAVKHTPRGGTVRLEARQKHDEIEITVSDSGPGIPEAQQKRIFEKFSQLGNGAREGLGLGLYISKWIVEAHGGTITVASKPGEGCVFAFTVPVAEA